MNERLWRYALVAFVMVVTSVFVAAVNLPHNFQSGAVIRSSEVNANFDALNTAKQERVTGICAAGSAIRTVNEDGTVECEVDDIGSGSGNAGVAALNSQTGAITLQAGNNVIIDDSQQGQIVISAGGGGSGSSNAWSLTGNAGTTAGTNFLGTTDDEAFEIHVDGERALRLEPSGESPNLIAGHSSNAVALGATQPSVVGATIGGGGGGSGNLGNQVTDDFGTVAGGTENQAGDSPIIGSDKPFASVGGGWFNRAQGGSSTVAGGSHNTAEGDAAAIAGGGNNSALGDYAAVPGGHFNAASGELSFAAGFRARANHAGSFVWSDSTNADFVSTTSNQFRVRASGGALFIKGGSSPTLTLAALAVENVSSTGEAAWLRSASASNSAPVLKLTNHSSAASNYLECVAWDGTNAADLECHINENGTFVSGSDFAEALPAVGERSSYEAGDVLVLSETAPGEVELAQQPYDVRVAGIFSTRPAVLGADKGGETRVDPEDVPVAIVGIVPTKVTAENGSIQAGDLLTTSSLPGHAMRASPVVVGGVEIYPTGTILGKALEPFAGERGVIRVLVMLR